MGGHDGVEPSVEMSGVIDEAVPGVGRCIGAAHSHEVRSKATSPVGEVGDDIAPKVEDQVGLPWRKTAGSPSPMST